MPKFKLGRTMASITLDPDKKILLVLRPTHDMSGSQMERFVKGLEYMNKKIGGNVRCCLIPHGLDLVAVEQENLFPATEENDAAQG